MKCSAVGWLEVGEKKESKNNFIYSSNFQTVPFQISEMRLKSTKIHIFGIDARIARAPTASLSCCRFDDVVQTDTPKNISVPEIIHTCLLFCSPFSEFSWKIVR